MPTTTVPPGMDKLPRFVLHPRGPKGPGFTLALYGATLGVVSYRLYMKASHEKRSRVIFAGMLRTTSKDWISVASQIFRAVTVRPGDMPGESTAEMNPEQLAFVLAYGEDLRAEAARRFDWSPAEARPLRVDLEPVYSRRRDLHGSIHSYAFGALEATGSTRASAKSGIMAAVKGHCSMKPVFGVREGKAFALYADGVTYRVQEVDPQRPQAPLGQLHTLAVKTAREAEKAFAALLSGTPKAAARAPRRTSARAFNIGAA